MRRQQKYQIAKERRSISLVSLALALLGAGSIQGAVAKVIEFDPPGSEATLPSAINANGWIGGWYEDITGIYGFMRDPSGNLTKIDVRGSGCAATTAVTALNSQNIAVGVGYDSSCVQSAFVRAADGTITTFEEPGATLTEAVSINDAGAICGFYNLSSGSSGFVRSPGGRMTTINVPGSFGTTPVMINNKNVVVGTYFDAIFATHAFIRSAKGKITTFDIVADAEFTQPQSINDAGDISGNYSINGSTYGFIRKANGKIKTIDPNGSQFVNISSINDNGDASGFYDETGFVRTRNGTITPIKIRNGTDIEPTSINNADMVTGNVQDNSGVHGFIFEPRR